jgi:hypothetical protein
LSIIKHNLPTEETQIEIIENDLLLPEYGEAMLYHDAGRFGYVKIGVRDNHGWHEEAFRVEELPERLKYLPKHRDSYLTQSEFKLPQKAVSNFLRTQLNFLDCDIYKIPLYQGREPEELRDIFLLFCADNGIPTPSLIVFSGQGLYPKWLLDYPIPYRALAKWKRMQQELLIRLTPLGADPQAISVTNVLRIENTVNTKTGNLAKVIWIDEDHGKVTRWDFDTLADEVLPHTKAELTEMYRKRAEAKKKHGIISSYDSEVLRQELEQANRHNRQLTIEHLALARLKDLEIIANAHFGPMGVPEGERVKFMYIAGAFLAQIIKDPLKYYPELRTMHQKLTPSLPWNEIQSSTSTVYRKMLDAFAGKKEEYRGRKVDPRYFFTNQYLMEQLHVTPAIERKCITIFGRDERRRRQRVYREKARREQGVLDRKVYMLKRHEGLEVNIKKARGLHTEGKSVKDVALEMGKSVETIRSYLYRR